MNYFYWERHPDGPFATLIAVAATYCHPEAYHDGYADLVSRARSPQAGDDEIRVFTAELRDALADPGQLPGDELSDAVEYSDGSDEAFLRRLWRDMFPGEPVPGTEGAVSRTQQDPARRGASAGLGGPARTWAGPE